MVCSCVAPSDYVLLQIIFCSCAIETTLSGEKWQIASLSSQRVIKIKYENKLGDLSNRPQVFMVYRLINHLGCWKNTRRIAARDLRILRVCLLNSVMAKYCGKILICSPLTNHDISPNLVQYIIVVIIIIIIIIITVI